MNASRCLLALALAACGNQVGDPPAAPPAPPSAPSAAAPLVAERVEPSGPSIYALPIQLRAASGQAIGLDAAAGHPVVIAMFYASCPAACPVMIAEIQQLLAELPGRDVRVVMVSFDPARDTPEKLRALAATRRLDARWTLAAAAEPDARALAAVLDVKYRRLDSGEFFHGATIVALDREGRIVARSDRAGQREALVAALR